MGYHSRMENLRNLVVIPTRHTAEEANLAEKPLLNMEVSDNIHAIIRQYFRGLRIDFKKARIYQDGLPNVNGSEVLQMIKRQNRPIDQLLQWLRSQRAQIMGTEDLELI